MIEEWTVKNKLADFMERKPLGIAYHWRGLSAEDEEKIAKTVEGGWENRLSKYNLELKSFDGGLEIRYIGINKGSAVDSILGEYGDNFTAAYLGDDLTDEDAFKALGDRGLKILVRKERRPTAADIILSPPRELLAFLQRWHRTTSGTE
jgi:trehalose 6-phosphate synthase/trehalose 6-phosphate phosphatase